MITYHKSPFGVSLLFRLHGSAVYRATIPALFSVIFLLLIRSLWHANEEHRKELNHPYTLGVLIGTTTFFMVFRVQIAYGRYWEAVSSVHFMMSKWMDATIHMGNYHMQCDHYKNIKPPSFYKYPELNKYGLSRDRERTVGDCITSERIGTRAVSKSIESVVTSKTNRKIYNRNGKNKGGSSSHQGPYNVPTFLEGSPRLDGNWSDMYDDNKATFYNPQQTDRISPMGFASYQGGRTPALFLQELAHLSSLMTAVALSTLRNDVEGAESPLDIYIPGSPWPEVDPDKVKEIPFQSPTKNVIFHILNFIGVARTPEERTKYNASRPMPVLGGVSDGEIRFLQTARGPYAKTQLCWSWLSEFSIREHLAGSTGAVGPPIISRVIQFLGDGMIYYNHARKIMQMPFPFPHAQLSAVYMLIIIPCVALLMDQFVKKLWLGCILSFLSVTALAAIHEVARELENPFRNIPNELPLVTFQAQYNEALITMYSGFHPDLFWEDDAKAILERKRNEQPEAYVERDSEDDAAEEAIVTDVIVHKELQELKEQLKEQSKLISNLTAALTSGSINTKTA